MFRDFGLRMTAGECKSNARIDGKVVIITGGNTGIGKAAAIELAKRGGKIIIVCRDMEKAERAVEEIKASSNEDKISAVKLDLASMASVRECADKLLKDEPRIDMLINNAGVMMCPKDLTVDGIEMQFGVNHVGHFLFTMLLLPRLQESEAGKIINVSSAGHKMGTMDFDDINLDKSYSPITAYGRSKLANVLFTRELSKRLGNSKIHVYAVHPGFVNTELCRHIDNVVTRALNWAFARTPLQGAQTIIYCAVDENASEETGLYYSDCSPQKPSSKALSHEDARRLWQLSCQLVDIEDPLPRE